MLAFTVLGHGTPHVSAMPSNAFTKALFWINGTRTAPHVPVNLTAALEMEHFRVLYHQTHSLTPKTCIVESDAWTQDVEIVPLAALGSCVIKVYAVRSGTDLATKTNSYSAPLYISIKKGPVHEGDPY